MKRKLLLAMLFVASAIGFNANAQTDVTSTYLTNADFENEYSVYSFPREDGDNKRAIYQPNGWTLSYTNGDSNDMTCLNSECLQWAQFSGLRKLSSGENNTYWSRLRFGANTKLTLSQVATSVPRGTYRLSVDAYKNADNGVATISVAGKTATIDARSDWATYSIIFTLTETSDVTISYSFEGKGTDTRIGVDNFKLENITQGASDLSHNWTTTIANAGFESGSDSHAGGSVTTPYGYTTEQTMEGWQDGSINTVNPSEGSNLYNYWAGTTTSLNIYQCLQLPAGKYTITADLRTEEGKISDQGVYAKIGEDVFKSETIQTIGSPWNGAEAWNTLSKDFYVQSDGSVQVGASSTGGASSLGWFQIDNFQLTYKGAVQNTPYSFAQGTATAVTSDKWYAVNVPINGEYRIISSVDNTVYYTQNGYYAPSDAESIAVTAGVKQVVNLTTGTLYVRAINDATLTIEPDVYVYSIGDVTLSVVDGGYTQNSTFTVTFNSASTNDPANPVPALVTGTKATVNGADVALVAATKGFTIDLGSLTSSSDYTISIPAGVYGYESVKNSAISLTVHTPAVFDGVYYIATSDGNRFISRGGDSNTEATLDEYGIAVRFETDANNVTHAFFVDNDKNLFGGSASIYTDKNETDLGDNAARARWIIAKVTGGYTLYSIQWSKYIKAGTGAESGKTAATYSDDPYTWTLVSPSGHSATIANYKDENAAAVATYAGLSATSVATLKSIIEGGEWIKSNISVTNAFTSVSEHYQPNEYKENIFDEQSLTGLKNGLYKVSISAFHRMRGNAETYSLHNLDADASNVYLYAGSDKVQLPSVMSEYRVTAYTGGWGPNYEAETGKNYPNNTANAEQAFNDGKYSVEVFTYVTDGTLKIGMIDPGKYNNYNWICYRDLKLTYYKEIDEVAISEDVDYIPVASDYANVTLTRTIKADTWNTFVVPFDINETELKAAFGSDVAIAEYSESADGDNSTVTFTTMTTPAVEANVPVLLKTSTAGTSYNFTGRTIETGDAKVTGTNFDFVGNYVASLPLANGDYYISANTLYKKGEGATVTLKGTRAYIKAKTSGVKSLKLVINDEVATGITEMSDGEGLKAESDVLYNVNGQVVDKNYKGIVIKNGKKYYQK